MTKYLEPPTVAVGLGPQISEWIKSKEGWEEESLLVKDKAGCLANWHDTQSTESCLTWPKKPLETKGRSFWTDTWPKRKCQRLKEKQKQYEQPEIEGVSRWKVGGVKWARTSVPLYCLSQELDSFEDPVQDNQKNQTTSQNQVHIIDQHRWD